MDNELKKETRKKLDTLQTFIEDELGIEIIRFLTDITVKTIKGKHKEKKTLIVSLNFTGSVDVTKPFDVHTDAILSADSEDTSDVLEASKFKNIENPYP